MILRKGFLDDPRVAGVRVLPRWSDRESPRFATIGAASGLNPACFNFTGSNFATVTALSTNIVGGGGSFTISSWVKGSAADGANRVPWAVRSDANNYLAPFVPRAAAAELSGSWVVNGSSPTFANTAVSATDWYKLTMTWNHADYKIRFYVNGSLIRTSGAASGGFASLAATSFFLGTFNSGTFNYDSCLADVRIYSAAVTPNHSIPMTSESNGVAWYISPKSDGSIVDSLGNGNTLTTSGDSLYGASGGPGLPWWPV